MSRMLAAVLALLVLGSNALGGIAWLCHHDGQAHDEPCCESASDEDAPPQLGDQACCEQLSQLRVTQAVERAEVSAPHAVVLAVLALVQLAPAPSLESLVAVPEQPWTGPPRPGGGPLLAQGRSLLI